VFDKLWSTSLSNTSRSEELNRAGRPVSGYLLTITAHRTVSIAINYRDRTWSKTVYPFGSSSSSSSPGPAAAPGPAPRRQTPLQAATALRAQVKAGRVTLAGHTTMDGQRAIHLRERQSGGLISMWVSPATYLPIRVIETAAGVPATSPRAVRDDYRWLPATPANLRLLTRAGAIPASFTRVSAHH
jgi:hypothetical protein